MTSSTRRPSRAGKLAWGIGAFLLLALIVIGYVTTPGPVPTPPGAGMTPSAAGGAAGTGQGGDPRAAQKCAEFRQLLSRMVEYYTIDQRKPFEYRPGPDWLAPLAPYMAGGVLPRCPEGGTFSPQYGPAGAAASATHAGLDAEVPAGTASEPPSQPSQPWPLAGGQPRISCSVHGDLP